ncbi:MAG: GNAT family N-acetyltransferase [Clostridium sp.]|nr:GNAT family N-acetyltransferase [Clostridium sp.]
MIYLNRMTEGDLPLILKWKRQEHYLSRRLNLQYDNLSMNSQKIWFKNINENDKCMYWIIKSGSIKIGIADINHIDYKEKKCDMECIIGDIHFRNRGIKPIVLYNLYEYAFDKLNMDEVCRRIRIDSEKEYDFESENAKKVNISMNKDENPIDIKYVKIKDSDWRKIRNEYSIEKVLIH